MRSLGIRGRLALWYGGVVAVVLVGFSCLVYFMMSRLPLMDEPLTAELAELSQLARSADTLNDVTEHCERYFRRREGYRFQVRSADGRTLFRSERLGQHNLPLPHVSWKDAEPVVANHRIGGVGHFRVASARVEGAQGTLIVQAALSLAPYDHQLWRLKVILLLTVPLAVICALAGGYLVSRQALAPLDEMALTASTITAHDLNRRIVISNPHDELGRLGETLNRMIARLERSFDEVRRFTADAAHELRTPLAIMRSEAEIALRSPRPPQEYRRVIESMLEETAHLAQLAEQLLFLCREDAGLRSGSSEVVPVSELLDDVADQMRVAAGQRKITISSSTERGCYINGDLQRIRRLFLNLIDNAIKYTIDGGTVHLACVPAGNRIEVTVEDTGCGIPAEYLPFIFDRFYRVDASRNPEAKGTGLGLAICRSVVEAHGGTIEVRSTVGVGTRFKVTFPAAQISDLEQPAAPVFDGGRATSDLAVAGKADS
jgi:heavy metal sensor kinase